MKSIIILSLSILLFLSTIHPSISSNAPTRDPKCIAVDSYHTYICTDNPEASRRAVSSSFTIAGGSSSSSSGGGGGDANANPNAVMESPFDMDLGVEQRITGSETEQLRIRNVLRKMYNYFDDEVLTRSEYEHVRGRCKNEHELCAFWTSVGECESNRGFMLENCAAACRLCLLANTNMMA
mmetsp:Transcript_1248/g.2229  ORF Transcript_1248/g.2229 Transcript_1248/m.2229 type:complete len:181 (+) Transcript_1248:94-636(+)|eukprot:CAMPEP_0183715232 /NCGR_PEP_ID=MMETSP0737-20130205/9552_1 /TAXON_ID=385413 /ORGANISM="Thalassiosira miniscula, Strain CCMP1093" /LENGTH=180 /DNA_ID=CAMNT_0025944321 /DNA_START=80 /DNA_END=622 /DNA_ORIENTATION=-